MILDFFTTNKTLKGALVMLAGLALQKYGVDKGQVMQIIGAAITIIGFLHKLWKLYRSKRQAVCVK